MHRQSLDTCVQACVYVHRKTKENENKNENYINKL